uniref:Uncharacterized mitochondrial protein AtMg00810-like n=1 Tax=Tanacetum cinerariifolium TaxID=118510 RepID=A0A699H9W9_TANCI|nr:uncharacterized mitochondrial protein AtMg00810-like [Tanacetum cinerariifolium]
MLQHGILHESSCVYIPSQNRVAKCKNRHLLEGYRCYSPQLHRYLVLRDVTFHEDLPYFLVTTYRHQEENDDLLVYVSPTPVETTKQSAKLDGLPHKVYDSAPSMAYGKSNAPSDASSDSDSPSPSPTPKLDLPIALRKVPKTVGEALAHSGWRATIIEEMNALEHNSTWVLVDLPVHKNPIGCKWVFSVKINLDGLVARLKARLVKLRQNSVMRYEDGRLLHNPEKYRQVVGKLNYLTITRPDIAFPVSVVSQFLTGPRTLQWDAVTQILRYLKGTPGLDILYANHGYHIVEGFTDADYAGCPNTSRSIIGYCIFVGNNLVSWKSKKQYVVSRSSLGAEYRAIAQTTCELVWLRNLLGEIGFP